MVFCFGDQEVGGSNPLAPTKSCTFNCLPQTTQSSQHLFEPLVGGGACLSVCRRSTTTSQIGATQERQRQNSGLVQRCLEGIRTVHRADSCVWRPFKRRSQTRNRRSDGKGPEAGLHQFLPHLHSRLRQLAARRRLQSRNVRGWCCSSTSRKSSRRFLSSK
jgi:hypothetical protein